MEDVLEVYTRPHDPKRPVVCMDEKSYQLLVDKVEPLPPKPGKPGREDYEYERNGVVNLFMLFEPLAGWRHVEVSEHRTSEDWAFVMRELSLMYPEAEKIVVVMDNLNTHTPASFYKVFEPEEAFELSQRFEFHYTPKHGSWLNMAEIELSVLARECLSQRIGDINTLARYVSLWEKKRNSELVKVDWRFKTQDARIKLKRLYPVFKNHD